MVVLLPYVFQALSILYNLAAEVGFSSTDNNSRCGTAIPLTNTLNKNIHKTYRSGGQSSTALTYITSGLQHLRNRAIRLQ